MTSGTEMIVSGLTAHRLQNDLGAWKPGQEEHVGAYRHLEKELEDHTVHVCGGEHRDHPRIAVHVGFGLAGELHVGEQRPVGYHHTLGESRSTGSIAYEGQFLWRIDVIPDVIFPESGGVAFLHMGIYFLKEGRGRGIDGTHHFEIGQCNHHLHAGQVHFGHVAPDVVAHKEYPGLGMGDQMTEIGGLEFVEDRYHDRAVGHAGQICHRPVDLVAGTDGYLVTFLQTAVLEKQMEFGDLPGDILIIKCLLIVIAQSGAVPVLLEAFFKKHIEGPFSGWFLCHSLDYENACKLQRWE